MNRLRIEATPSRRNRSKITVAAPTGPWAIIAVLPPAP
jgi:hypothetical protein